MKAIYLVKYGDAKTAFEIKEIPMPTLSVNQVLIKVAFSGLNFADVIARRGIYPDAPPNPACLGYDVTGEIVDIGEKVTGFSIGQKVVAMTRFGGYAEYVAAEVNGLAVLPDHADMGASTVLATQACTAYFAAHECTTLHPGEKVLIQAAAGGVGSILVQLAKARGCEIFGTASTAKQAYLSQIGVDHPIDYTKENFYDVIHKKGIKVDAVFDSLGGTAFAKGVKLLAPGGRMICFGAAEQLESAKNKFKLISLALGFGLFSPISLLMQSKSIITINMLRIADFKPTVFNAVLKNVLLLFDKGIIQPQVSQAFRYDQIAEAHTYLENRKSTGKVVIFWE